MTSYTYDSLGRLTKTTSTGAAGDSISVEQAYDPDTGTLNSIKHNDFNYYFIYDVFGNRTSVNAADHAQGDGSLVMIQCACIFA